MSKCKECPYWNGSECVSTECCIDDGISEDLANERDEAYRRSVESEYYEDSEDYEDEIYTETEGE